MAAPTMSYLICSMGLIVLIFAMPFFYSIAMENISVNMMQKELKEIADYTSNTLGNLYFLANSTNREDIDLTKQLLSLPSTIENSPYILMIEEDDGAASRIIAYLRDKSWISANAWLVPGLKLGEEYTVESGGQVVFAGCTRNVTGYYVWLKKGE